MQKYVYLPQKEFVRTWVIGGQIPIRLATSYRREERSGSYTPDEGVMVNSSVDLNIYHPFISKDSVFGSLTVIGGTMNGLPIPDVTNARRVFEDGLVLCFSNSFSIQRATKFNAQACVRIFDIGRFKRIIDRELGVVGEMASCRYTAGYNRNHFLKSNENAWQDEFRLFWPGSEEKWVTIPGGQGAEVDLHSQN